MEIIHLEDVLEHITIMVIVQQVIVVQPAVQEHLH